MIYLFTDFGTQDFYVGQLKAVLQHIAPGQGQIDLFHDATSFDVTSAAHLLHALSNHLPSAGGDVVLAVIDPGVGGSRRPVALQADDVWFVGPDNGLLSVVAQHAVKSVTWEIVWRPERGSESFHGRDLFAPVAAWLARGELPLHALRPVSGLDVLLEAHGLPQVIHIDHYGNVMTGIRAGKLSRDARLLFHGELLQRARVFCEVPVGEVFWYENSIGLVEIAVSRGSAADRFGVMVGDVIEVVAA